MVSRRHVASVADGIARSFASRNNDIEGWWALGLLLTNVGPGEPDYRIDLLTGDPTPPSIGPELGALGPAWARYLRWSLERHGLQFTALRSAVLSVRFDRSKEVKSWIPGARDRPFECTVTIEDDRGRRHERSVFGHCSRPGDFTNPNPYMRPRPSAGPYDPGRVARRIRSRDAGSPPSGDISEH